MTKQNSLHIALFVPDLEGRSGWSRYAVDLGKALHAEGHRLTAFVARTCEHIDWCNQLPLLADDLQYMTNPLRCFAHVGRVRKALRNGRFDVVHIVYEPSALLLGVPGTLHEAVCLTLHSTYAVMPLRSGIMARWLMKRAYAKANLLIAVSAFTKNMLCKEEPALWQKLQLGEKTTVIYNSIDVSRMQPRADKSIGTASTVRMVSVGGVKPRKGYMEAIRAVAAYKARSTRPVRYDIYGALHDTSYVQDLREYIRESNLSDSVYLHGSVDDTVLAKAYDDADVFLLLSKAKGFHAEGYGLVFLEANAWGTPVIAPNTGGCPEAVEEGRSGFVCDAENSAEVAEAIARIIDEKVIAPSSCIQWAAAHASALGARAMADAYASVLRKKN